VAVVQPDSNKRLSLSLKRMDRPKLFIIVFCLLFNAQTLTAAGPMLEPGVSLKLDLNYQYSLISRPLAPVNEPDTADVLLPIHKSFVRLRKRFSLKDVFVFRYVFRDFKIYENSYQRFLHPIKYEFEHQVKIGVGYNITPKFTPFCFYEYLKSRNQYEGHSAIFGSRISVSAITMLEPTYVITLAQELIRHTLLLRVRQVLLPTVFIMLKNTHGVASSDTLTLRSNILEAYFGWRVDQKTALHFGCRSYYNFDELNSHTLWFQIGRQLPGNFTIWSRYRYYFRTEDTLERGIFNSNTIEIRIVRTPLVQEGLLKNCSSNLKCDYYINNNDIKAFSVGLGLSYVFPLKK